MNFLVNPVEQRKQANAKIKKIKFSSTRTVYFCKER